ncbi:hypothetical protein H6G80_19265 [Nostoc sp. FACHB-87]|uniref:Uncharacterized protein n=1 Tax=Nostoc spongiaeforme FACHB-130 TaxID=1357510 RepID=A0ABR8FSP9_9NOSO|nr:hypothetical protein [Nostoc spongiaeforme]MBD2456204.1 hypothetical protein [Nostoc sp. FACHB-87]MBD2477624.1 hypothetical protein [Anabaena sp. FACHB-83]MBD2593054.1 hypothetical protein [Nostoc spongiaeforme FACHB-130]
MRTTTAAVHSHSAKRPASPNHPSSVPLYVYRELAAELEATQAQLDALNAKNQQLVQENKFLRQEIAKVLQSVSQLQKLVDFRVPESKDSNPPSRASGEVKNFPKQPKKEARPRSQSARPRPAAPPKAKRRPFPLPVVEIGSPQPETIFIEEQPVSYYPSREPEKREINGWGLVITIVLVMLTAFGAGYLIVRPLFAHQSN